MQTITENKEAALPVVNPIPSVLRQIIDEIDELQDDKKEELFRLCRCSSPAKYMSGEKLFVKNTNSGVKTLKDLLRRLKRELKIVY